nr:PREDICTED: beta-2-microglobulin [Opisthocomus hoazin]
MTCRTTSSRRTETLPYRFRKRASQSSERKAARLRQQAPEVEVYARNRAVDGEENTLNCFVSGFYPASIDIALLRNGEPMIGVQYGDMSFNDKWYFQRLVHAPFVPHRGDIYVCRVTHSAFTEPQSFRWEPDF